MAVRQTVARVVRPVVVRGLLAKERLKTGVTFNPLSRQWRDDPVPLFERLREKDPVHYSELIGGWVVSRHEDVDAILRDHHRFSSDPRRGPNADVLAALEVTQSMLNLDPPDHTRTRSLVTQAFTPRAIEGWRERIEAVISDLFAEIGEAAEFDVMECLAVPLPVVVIAEILGVPPSDLPRFKAWSDDIARTLEPSMSAEDGGRAQRARQELGDYFGAIIEARRAEPRDDLITSLVQAEAAGERLTHDELLATLVLLLVAGNETTTNLIGNGTLALLRHPEQQRWLRDHPEQVESAVEELLRFDSPVQINGRTTLVEVEVGGKRIPPQRQVILLQGAANYDPLRWERPHGLDLSRGDKGHLSFGRGIHYCVGAPLARMEAQMLFPRMLARWPNLRLAERDASFRPNVVLRGLERLPVRVD
ncbi:MAG: cytochrome P450 [Dehalococcoidia bacterium]|nr:cytochrome P450 [Dehalococcoidia bacterium]